MFLTTIILHCFWQPSFSIDAKTEQASKSVCLCTHQTITISLTRSLAHTQILPRTHNAHELTTTVTHRLPCLCLTVSSRASWLILCLPCLTNHKKSWIISKFFISSSRSIITLSNESMTTVPYLTNTWINHKIQVSNHISLCFINDSPWWTLPNKSLTTLTR